MDRDTWIIIGIAVAIVGIITLIGAIKLGRRLFVTKRMLGELGTGGKVAFWGALIYTIFPVDLLPDPIYLDDMGVLALALMYLTNLLRKRHGGKLLPGPRTKPSTKQDDPR
ncbi:YkvA family protein [Catellatospora sichuanensis]|uniref:YkvA family protein n=1 Tax=Catellatospora sichuanensis TaxID=1969805 RepID=UPI0011832C71|nr:YkvA family protein [Catellatospora sichuanensis]